MQVMHGDRDINAKKKCSCEYFLLDCTGAKRSYQEAAQIPKYDLPAFSDSPCQLVPSDRPPVFALIKLNLRNLVFWAMPIGTIKELNPLLST